MIEQLKKRILTYYLLSNIEQEVWIYQDRINFVKKLLNRVIFSTGVLGVLFLVLFMLDYKFASKIVFPFFMASLIPYYFYAVSCHLLRKEKNNT
ncbi:hypothetical protein Lqui_2434 [Legionella quinlivanii]|uniref:Uncharacterized protein n=1 Tax=Legionella quinlivanii TaxID=45073 RepID=A0A0W0XSK5_9GAMM|nr:hypothetical protein Lqui_2434 [Legionella quinlivanii]STY49804.1 Uncharacterised protein [Legionella quinlivanii]